MKVNTPVIHVWTESGNTEINGMLDTNTSELHGIVIFDIKGTDHRVYIHWQDDKMRRQLIYSLMTVEELERFTTPRG